MSLIAATHGSEFSATFINVGSAVALLIVIVGAVLLYRDTERHGGPSVRVALAWILFWPLGLWWWRQSRRDDQAASHAVDRVPGPVD